MPAIPQQMFTSRMPTGVGININLGNGDTVHSNVVKSCAVQLKNTMIQHLYPHSIAELMCNCIMMLYEAICNKLHHSHFTDADIDDVNFFLFLNNN